MSGLDYRIEIEPLPSSEGGGFVARVPDLPGCTGDGESYQEALDDAIRAIAEWKAQAKAMGRAIPQPSRGKRKELA